jgi:hypothetical protein
MRTGLGEGWWLRVREQAKESEERCAAATNLAECRRSEERRVAETNLAKFGSETFVP